SNCAPGVPPVCRGTVLGGAKEKALVTMWERCAELEGFAAPKHRMIVTAPHRGSEVNDASYGVIRAWLKDDEASPIYVRNGGHRTQRLAAFLKETHRCCAQCRTCAPRKLARRVTQS